MNDLIKRQDALKIAKSAYDGEIPLVLVAECIKALPSADAEQGVGRYENAMQKLRELPSYLNGVKAKQIKKISADAVQGDECDHCVYKLGIKGGDSE